MKAVRADPALRREFKYDPISHYGVALHDYMRAAAGAALSTDGLLTLKGEWIRAHDHGYDEFFNDYLDRLPADAYVVRVRYHG